jgi:hypothetical protein
MTARLPSLLLAGVVAAGLALAQEPQPGQDEPPVRLKKKGKPNAGQKPKAEPDKPDEKKAKEKEPPAPEPPPLPSQPQINEQEVLNRVARTLQSIDQRLAKNDLGEGTRQAQDDAVKDLEKLIAHAQQPPEDQDPSGGQQGGQGGQQGQQGESSKSGSREGSQTGQQSGGGKAGPNSRQGRLARRLARAKGRGRQLARGPSGAGLGEAPKNGGRDGTGDGGRGSKNQPKGLPNRNADLYKDAWGNLPESLRAEMRAYSNPEPFLAKYDDLIRKYYRTLAEQGRKKGD